MLTTYLPHLSLATPAQHDAAPSLAELLSALSFALDLTEAAVPGHALRSCLLGMRLGRELGFSPIAMADLYPALLLKDLGCSSNAARMSHILGGGDERALKSGLKLQDWTRPGAPGLATLRLLWSSVLPQAGPLQKFRRVVRIQLDQRTDKREMIELRSHRAAALLRKIGMSEQTAIAVRSLDEHWDGSGYPHGLNGADISPLARVLAVAQHLDLFAVEQGAVQAMLVLRQRSGRWFDPETVKAAESLHHRLALWQQRSPSGIQASTDPAKAVRAAVIAVAPPDPIGLSGARIDVVCEAFAQVVDAKSPFTSGHSTRVAQAARKIGAAMGLAPERLQLLHRAALLHDLGKLRVPNSILDQPARLNQQQWFVMQQHPALTRTILRRVTQFRELADVAGAHQEKLDGTGYPNKLSAGKLSLESRILCIAGIYSALTENRPYRSAFSPADALKIMQPDVPSRLDPDCLQALSSVAEPAARERCSSETLQPPYLVGPQGSS